MHDDRPLVSIITPTYNRADFIADTLRSVLNQTYGHFEYLIVDDGSTDDTEAVVEPFLGDSRIRYWQQPNRGQSRARNAALDEARGVYVCFIDSDDLWVPDKLEKQVALLNAMPEVDIAHGDEIFIDAESREIGRQNMQRYSGFICDRLLVDNSVSITTAMVRRECLTNMGGFSEAYPVADDYELWLRLSSNYQFYYMAEYLAYYRVMADQISSDTARRIAVNEQIISDFLRTEASGLSAAQVKSSLARFYARKARIMAGLGKRWSALAAWLRVLRYAPGWVGTWRSGFRIILPKRH